MPKDLFQRPSRIAFDSICVSAKARRSVCRRPCCFALASAFPRASGHKRRGTALATPHALSMARLHTNDPVKPERNAGALLICSPFTNHPLTNALGMPAGSRAFASSASYASVSQLPLSWRRSSRVETLSFNSDTERMNMGWTRMHTYGQYERDTFLCAAARASK